VCSVVRRFVGRRTAVCARWNNFWENILDYLEPKKEFSDTRLSFARDVLRYSPELARDVMNGIISLDEAMATVFSLLITTSNTY